jgi:hypothetical protein
MSDIQTPAEGTDETVVTTPQDGQDPVAPEPIEVVTPAAPTGEAPEDVTPPQPEVVPKEKFVASQRESILNHERVQVANTRIQELTNTDTPTDEAMRRLYPEWDQLDDYNKKVLIRQETTAMQNAKLAAQNQEILARQQLEDQLEDIADKPEFAKLQGKEAEFRRFAKRKENQGIDVAVLAKAFLFDGSDEPTPAPATPAPREALPAGSGGPRESLKSKKISLAEAEIIKQTDYKRYIKLVKDDAIEM